MSKTETAACEACEKKEELLKGDPLYKIMADIDEMLSIVRQRFKEKTALLPGDKNWLSLEIERLIALRSIYTSLYAVDSIQDVQFINSSVNSLADHLKKK